MKKILLVMISLASLLLFGCAGSVDSTTQFNKDDQIVVLAHGLGRSDTAMWRFTQRLENAGYLVCTLNYASIGETVQGVFDNTTTQIDQCISSAPSVHFIGHSLGGLVIRNYLQNHTDFAASERLGQVILIGTPNKGSELADHFQDSWLMKVAGEVSQSLITGNTSLGNQIEELPIDIGVIAGTKSSILTNDAFTGPNDGLVSVDSTKLDQSSDFIALDVGHSGMRYNKQVAEQAIFYLKHGRFNHSEIQH
ncbi:alpha/beta hydrolase [Shewanella maritima]|uniref:alpha/beta hydrolase n=1 Tax=Shewanella maritima TaxID=2520507 RepID=UPI003736EEEB